MILLNSEKKYCDIKEIKINNGYYYFKLAKILHDHNISINKLMRDTDTDFKVIKRIIDGDLIRIDMDVMARFCEYFNCEFNDIIEYSHIKKYNL